jgi:hypothetical protein
MGDPKEKMTERGEPKYLFNIGDHVKTVAQELIYFGYVKERRPYKSGGNEYNVDFYSYAQGETWVVEWRLQSAPLPKQK